MPLDHEDTSALDISGDPPTAPPLSQKQMAGAQQAQVNRTRMGPHAAVEQRSDGHADAPDGGGGGNGKTAKQDSAQINADTPFLGGLQQMENTAKGEADQQLHFDPRAFNPLNVMDWAKAAIEQPVETYHMGRHIYDAFFGAFLDPGAIQASMHNIYEQDNAQSAILKFLTLGPAELGQSQQQQKQGEGQAAAVDAQALSITANPWNVLPFGGARGALLVAKMLGPSVAQAVFGQGDALSEMVWGGSAAALFGGRLPPQVEAKLAESAPGALKLFDKIGATKRAQDLARTAAQNRNDLLKRIMEQGPAQEKQIYAQGWQAGMKALSKEQELGLGRTLIQKYGTLDREKLIPLMVKGGESQAMVQKVWAKLLRMPENLMYVPPTESPLVNPTSYLYMMPAAARKAIESGHQWTLHVVNQAMMGPAGHSIAPETSRFYSLIGHQATNNTVMGQWEKHLREVGGKEIDDPAQQGLLSKALNGDQTAYLSLSAPMKYVRDSMRMVSGGLRLAAKDSAYSEDFVNNYWPRTALLAKTEKGFAAAGSRLLSRTTPKHRTLAAQTYDALTHSVTQVEQAYPTVAAANAAQQRLRSTISDQILGGSPISEITGVPETEARRVEQIRAIASDSPEVARKEAEAFAHEIAPDFSLNPLDSMGKIKSQLRAITSHRAISDLMLSLGKDGKQMAVFRPVNDDRAMRLLRESGYRPVDASGFGQVLVNSDYATLLERAARTVEKGGPGVAKALAEVEGTAVATIMYSPRIHGMNMAGRLGLLGSLHPIEVARWFGGGMIQKAGVTRVGHEEYRLEAWNAGVIPPHPGLTGWADRAGGALANLTGDQDLARTPLINDVSQAAGKVREWAHRNPGMQVVGGIKDALWGKQDDLWSWVSDFGVMAYHIEKAAALRGGVLGLGKMTEEQASQFAARRANSWMGHVLPEDTNPSLHALAKTLTFAPNWWRTWGELLSGYYKRAGWGWTPDTIKYVVQNEVRTALAAVAFQQLSANVLNLMLAGHTIYQNDPGNWGKVEITAPWATEILNAVPGLNLGIDPKTGRNAKGQKLTLENPLARQMTDTEQAMGMLTSSPNWSTATLGQGLGSFVAARQSPVVSALAAAANIDLYSSIASGGLRYMDPNHDVPFGSPGLDAFAALAQLTPFSYITNQIQQAMVQGQNPSQEMDGPFGLKVPKVIADTIAGLPADAAKALLVGMTGINPPYERASKSFGVEPTDDQYRSVHEIQDTYTQNMNALSSATLSGQMTPYQWIAAYRQLSTKRADQLQAIFKHAPEYNDGPLGLTNSWENLYDQAASNGITDADKLRALQQEWRSKHSSADYAAVQSELRVNDQKYPMLALYHKTLDAYDNWQTEYCQANNIDLNTLRSDLSGYGRVYQDRNASVAWLRDHPEIEPFENAKKAEFESGTSQFGEAGLLYALFFNPTGADRYLAASGQDAAQVEAAVTQQSVAAAS